jgi:hypothetical protein
VSPTILGRCQMQEVADWLEKLGLRKYAQRFAESDKLCSIRLNRRVRGSGSGEISFHFLSGHSLCGCNNAD